MPSQGHPWAGPAIGNAVVVHLRGDIDIVSAEMVDVLLRHAAIGPTDELVIDSSEVGFMECAEHQLCWPSEPGSPAGGGSSTPRRSICCSTSPGCGQC